MAMIRRSIRVGFRLGLLAGIAFALFKVVQGRRAASPLSGGSEWAAPGRTPAGTGRAGETPLVEPSMLQGVSLKKPALEAEDDEEATEVPAPPAPETEAPVEVPAPVAAKTDRAPAMKKAAKAVKKTAAKVWVDPKGAICPSTHPLKAKMSSRIYHLPGMLAYERTTPDRCYQDEDSAETDGFRKAKR